MRPVWFGRCDGVDEWGLVRRLRASELVGTDSRQRRMEWGLGFSELVGVDPGDWLVRYCGGVIFVGKSGER